MVSIFRFFIYSNLFIALCALLMVNQTYELFLQIPPNEYLLGFVCSGTICSYSFHWWLTSQSLVESPRIEWLKKYRIFHLVLFFIGIIGSVTFFFFLLPHWFSLLVGAIITFLYSAPKIPHPYFKALRKIAIGKTIFLALVWMYATTILPVVIEGMVWTTPIILFVIGRFFFIYAICIMFDFRDRADDQAAGIRSMVTWFSEKGVNTLFAISLVIYGACTLLLLRYDFSPLQIGLLLLPALITAALYEYAKNNFSDYLYYFVLDGLMMFSALLMLIIHV
jgi:4-hydroxybenzoate polyprenyltransferase